MNFASQKTMDSFYEGTDNPNLTITFQPRRNKCIYIFFFDSHEQKMEWQKSGFYKYKFTE